MNRPHLVLLSLLACTVLATVAGANPGINLAWNNCPAGVGSAPQHPFACDDDVSIHTLVASFVPPDGITQLMGQTATIDVLFADPQQPDWWALESGGCREGSVAAGFTPVSMTGCTRYWSGQSVSSVMYSHPFGSPNLRIEVALGTVSGTGGPVSPDREYYAFQLQFTSEHTTGADPAACARCNGTACLFMQELKLVQPPGVGDFILGNPLESNLAVWQCGSFTIADPGGIIGCAASTCPTPAKRTSWGQVRSLYR
jgi:hypothetical protein